MFVALANGKTKILPKDIFSNPQTRTKTSLLDLVLGNRITNPGYYGAVDQMELREETPYIHSLEIMIFPIIKLEKMLTWST
ncbi:MAG: hypothetical protein CM1200mP3_07510 [Chloroflexota bacterium]|nr:MAG: hypothetical protein CM1200mP3_07510 [Chloroflexota bacterium]